MRGALLPCGGAGLVPHTSPESAASAPVTDVADDDALQAGELHSLTVQLQLLAQTDTHGVNRALEDSLEEDLK